MSVVRILRNLAVLVILAMAVLGSPRPAAAKKTKGFCVTLGQDCGRYPCCRKLVCGSVGNRSVCQFLK
jgi:hypothetical protein